MYEVGIPAKQRPAMWEANVAGTERVMEAALEEKIPRIVYVSTVGIFGNTHKQVVDESYKNPETDFTSYYEETKLEAHKLVQRMIDEQDLPAIIVQPGGVYGPGDTSQVADLLEQFFAGKLPLLPFPELGICMTHVEDIAGGILLALDKGKLGETYVISGPATTMREAIETVARVSGRKAPKRDLPTGLMKVMIPVRAGGREGDGAAAEPARADLFWPTTSPSGPAMTRPGASSAIRPARDGGGLAADAGGGRPVPRSRGVSGSRGRGRRTTAGRVRRPLPRLP